MSKPGDIDNAIIIKLGGRVASEHDLLTALGADLYHSYAGRAILVHGGGAEASAWCTRLGLEPRFIDGVRQTTPEEMEIVEMVLAGKVNTAVVRTLEHAGARAVGLSLADGGLCTGYPIGDPAINRTAKPGPVDARIIRHLLSGGAIPVLSSIASFADGGACNINADDAALALGEGMKAETLVFLSDIPGVTEGDFVHRTLDREHSEALIEKGVISGGMTAKVRSALAAVDAGVGAVVIGEYRDAGDIEGLIEGRNGTRIIGSGGEHESE
ncbi:MAG: acetylglutamate kinase [Spirochaetia bacterium]